MPALKKLIASAVLGVAISATFAQAADRKAAVEQVEFGIDAAKAGLWREATYRWERAVELDPGYAAAFNNLAIAYETGRAVRRRRSRPIRRPRSSTRRTRTSSRTSTSSRKSTTVRTARTLASAAVALAASGCLTFIEVPVETPIRPKIDASPFARVYVAGFLPSGSEDVDTNLETVRLLRSQLKNKGGMRIIEADVLPLADAARPVPAEGTPAAPAGAAQAERRQVPHDR